MSESEKKKKLQIFTDHILIFKFLSKILGICDFDVFFFFFFFFCSMKGNDYYNIHKESEVHLVQYC